MKINVQLADLENNFEALLIKNITTDQISWVGYIEGYEGDHYKILVITDKDDNILHIKKGSKILSSYEDIKEEFFANLVEIKQSKIENEISGLEDTEDRDFSFEFKPYDPEKIRVDTKTMGINYIFEMMNSPQRDLDLSPDFQRNIVWTDITRKSRLIESILLRIPLPVFYFSQDEEGIFQVIDGVQRLSVIKDYLSNKFKLKNLEYLEDCEGCYFNKESAKSLEPKYVRRIKQTQLYCNIIDPQTPPNVKFDIFKRINTGGKPLNNQEIRNCFANPRVRFLLRGLASSDEFLGATGGSISSIRMADQELVMRFIGFYYMKILKSELLKYKGDMNQFLDETLELLNKEDESKVDTIKWSFLNSMKNSQYLFGDYAFRKCKTEHIKPHAKKQLINRSLFTSISVLLSVYSFEDIVSKNETMSLIRPLTIALDNNFDFYDAITNGTSDRRRIDLVFDCVEIIIEEHLKV